MKEINIFLLLLIAVVILLIIVGTSVKSHVPRYAPNVEDTTMTVILPEEGNIAEVGDTFIVEKVSNDSIYLGYKFNTDEK